MVFRMLMLRNLAIRQEIAGTENSRYGHAVEWGGPAEGAVLSRCANAQCSKPFLRLGQGRLFLIETGPVANPGDLTPPRSPYARIPPRHVERYWLCDQCAQSWTLVHDHQQGIGLAPLRRGAHPGAIASVAGHSA